ncbi:MAG: DUF1993 domain-containing protein [Pseudomonadales bacterium]|nr:DUF1993 domain-containing protein [Pseudomonadales bacterium]
MSVSLYDISVTSYLQVLGAVEGFLEKGRVYCGENNIDLDKVVETRLYPDMNPFRFQVISVAHHSMGSMKGLASGEFAPPAGYGKPDYAGLQTLVAEAKASVASVTEDAAAELAGGQVLFALGEHKMPFTTENFVMSFSLPNLYFHATTTYDILRMQGVPLGKIDFMGSMRLGT